MKLIKGSEVHFNRYFFLVPCKYSRVSTVVCCKLSVYHACKQSKSVQVFGLKSTRSPFPLRQICFFFFILYSSTLSLQGSTPTFQLTSQVAGDILDVTTMSVRLLAKLASGNRKPPPKTEFLLVCG